MIRQSGGRKRKLLATEDHELTCFSLGKNCAHRAKKVRALLRRYLRFNYVSDFLLKLCQRSSRGCPHCIGLLVRRPSLSFSAPLSSWAAPSSLSRVLSFHGWLVVNRIVLEQVAGRGPGGASGSVSLTRFPGSVRTCDLAVPTATGIDKHDLPYFAPAQRHHRFVESF